MTMDEEWYPSPCYGTSRGPYNKIVLHTVQCNNWTIRQLGEFFANGANQVSSHFGIDNFQRGVIGAYVMEQHSAWTQGNANPYCLSAELCGYAEWSRSKWLNEQVVMLDNTAQWVRWMSDKYGIPLRVLNNAQAQDPNYRGVCQHVNLGQWGGGHVDCGSGFPMDYIMEKASSGTVSSGGITVAGVAFDSSGRPWAVGSWKGNGQINVKVGDGPFTAIDQTQSEAIGGPGISYDPEGDRMRVVYINHTGKMCAYTTDVSPIKWGWSELGGSFQG